MKVATSALVLPAAWALCFAAHAACAHSNKTKADASPALYTLNLGGTPFPVRQVFFASFTPNAGGGDAIADGAGEGMNPDPADSPPVNTPPQPLVQVVLSSSTQGCAAFAQGGNNRDSTALTMTLSANDPNGLPLPIAPGTYAQAGGEGLASTGPTLVSDFEVGTYDGACGEALAGDSVLVDRGTLTLVSLGDQAIGSYSFTLAGGDGTPIAHDFAATSCPLDPNALNEVNPAPPCL